MVLNGVYQGYIGDLLQKLAVIYWIEPKNVVVISWGDGGFDETMVILSTNLSYLVINTYIGIGMFEWSISRVHWWFVTKTGGD